MSSSATDLPAWEIVDRMGGFAPPCWQSILRYFDAQEAETAAVEDLTAYIRDHERPIDDEFRIAVRLHHSTLPKLAASGVLDYDPQTRTARVADATSMAAETIDASTEAE